MTYRIVTAGKCSWCDKAKELMTVNAISFTEQSVRTEEVRVEMLKLGLRTVPQIWDAAGLYIGGFEDLEHHFEKVPKEAA